MAFKNRGKDTGAGWKNRGSVIEGGSFTDRGSEDQSGRPFQNRGQDWFGGDFKNRGQSLLVSAVWEPSALFASSEVGAWYDPSDLSTMFQDSAGTTPVTATGDPVGYMADKSGNNYHATQTDNAKRPTLAVDGNGKYYLAFAQTSALTFNKAACGSDYPLSMFVAACQNATADYCMVFSTDSLIEAVQLVIGNPQGAVLRNSVGGGTAGNIVVASTATITTNTPTFLGFIENGKSLYANVGGLSDNRTNCVGTFADGATFAAIGDGSTSGATNSYINFYGGIIIKRILDVSEQDSIGSFFTSKSAATYNDTKYAFAVGDSTIAAYSGNSAVLDLLTSANTEITIATAGDTIASQNGKFNALATNYRAAWVAIQVGLNDLNPAEAAIDAITRLQTLVNDVLTATGNANRVFISKLTPCKARLISTYGAVNGLVAYQKWLDINEAIAGGGANPITGTSNRITAHEPLMNDGSGNLAAAYDSGDGIHPNNAGRQIIADAWVAAVTAAGITV